VVEACVEVVESGEADFWELQSYSLSTESA
jgi:hypothetical protein